MPDIGDRHVIGIIKEFVPIEISIQNGGTEAGSMEFSAVVVDASDAAKEFLTIAKKVTVMIKIVDIHLNGALSKRAQNFIGSFVATFGNDLKGSLDAEGVVQVHERATGIAACVGLDVMGHCGATRKTVWPKPDERNALAGIGADDTPQHAIEQAIDRLVYGPAWKVGTIPSAKGHALQMLPYGSRQKGSHSVIGFATDSVGGGSTDHGHGAVITLTAQIAHNLAKVKGQNTRALFNAQGGGNIIERTRRVTTRLAGGDSAI